MIITINPLRGIDIANVGSIEFGQPKSLVEKIIGKPDRHSDGKRRFYDRYECRIDFDGSDLVEFIEFIYGPFPERITLALYGVDPFRLNSGELVELLSNKNAGEIDDLEAGHCYIFVDISVGIWRDMTEMEAEQLIAEKKASGDFEYDQSWLEEELAKSKHFWTIGIGKARYYKKN